MNDDRTDSNDPYWLKITVIKMKHSPFIEWTMNEQTESNVSRFKWKKSLSLFISKQCFKMNERIGSVNYFERYLATKIFSSYFVHSSFIEWTKYELIQIYHDSNWKPHSSSNLNHWIVWKRVMNERNGSANHFERYERINKINDFTF